MLNAWQDSVPLVVISGNVPLNTCSQFLNDKIGADIRCYGIQEHNIVKHVESVTKFAHMIKSVDEVIPVFVKALAIAMSGRKGPVWLDIPQDIQVSLMDNKSNDLLIDIEEKIDQSLNEYRGSSLAIGDISKLIKLLENSQRPMVLLGGGAANSKATIETVNHFVNLTNIPVVSTYAGTSIISHNYKPYLGCIGIKGSRAANFLLQNCDFLLVLGSRLPFGAIGYDIKSFALNAKIYVVEIDGNEILKNQYNFGERIKHIRGDVNEVVRSLLYSNMGLASNSNWYKKCVN